MDIRKGTIAELFKNLGYNYKDMIINQPYSVVGQRYKIKTEDGFNLILKIIRKSNSLIYRLITKDFVLFGSGDHNVSVFDNDRGIFVWKSFYDLVGLLYKDRYSHVATQSGLQSYLVESTGKIKPILDMELEKPNSYFANGILSHNTTWGSPETTTGGMALRFYSSIRLDIRKKTPIKDGTDVIGNEVKITVKKNKVAPPFKVAETKILFNEGISHTSELIKLGTEFRFLQKGGAGWFTFTDTGERIHGEKKLREKLGEDLTLKTELENLIRGQLRLPIIEMK